MTTNTDDDLTTQIINSVATALSIVGESSMLISYYFIPKIRTRLMSLVICLTISDVFASFSNVMSLLSWNNGFLCQIQGYVRTSAATSSFIWVFYITLAIYVQITKGSSITKNLTQLVAYNLLISLLFPLLPFLQGHFVEAHGYCTYSASEALAYFYTPFWVTFVVIVVMSCLIRRAAREYGAYTVDLRILMLYPIALIIAWTPGTIDRILTSLNVTNVTWLFYVRVFTIHSQGFMNFVVYGGTKKKEIVEYFCRNNDTSLFINPEASKNVDTSSYSEAIELEKAQRT